MIASQNTLTDAQANAVYDVLFNNAGASSDGRWMFIDSVRAHGLDEYRFGGFLGFGGKVRLVRGRVYVDCYPEDMDDTRREIIKTTNEALGGILA